MSKCEQCIVRKFSALKALTKEELVKMAQCKTSYIVNKGEAIFNEGEALKGIYCIKDGVGKLSKLSPNGNEQIVKLFKAGELIGQRSMLNEEVANLSAKAVEAMEVCFIPKQEIMSFFNENNEFSLNVLKNVCNDLKEADEIIVALAQKTVKARLAYLLVYLEDYFGKEEDGALSLQLSREEIAGMIGTATENCIRLLSDLKKGGHIQLIGKKIILLHKKELIKLSV